MPDPFSIIHKRSTRLFTGLKLWNIPGVTGLIKLSRSQTLRKPYFSIASVLQKNMERYEIELFKKYVKPGMKVVDIGANIGTYTCAAAKIVGKNGRVFAFEPEPENIKILKEKIKATGFSNVTLIQKALSNKSGFSRLYLDVINVGNHSLSKNNLLKCSRAIFVPTITLDEYLENKGKIDFIKMDVQGAEAKIIKGAKRTLKKWKPILMIEFWPKGLLNCGSSPLSLLIQLRMLGYKLLLIDKSKRKLIKMSSESIIKICEEKKSQADYTNLIAGINLKDFFCYNL